MATKITIDDALKRMTQHKVIDMAVASKFETSTICKLRSGIYNRTRFEKYINLLNFLYYDNETENRI